MVAQSVQRKMTQRSLMQRLGAVGLLLIAAGAIDAAPYPNGQPGMMGYPGGWQFPPPRQQPQGMPYNPQGMQYGTPSGPTPGYGYSQGYPNGGRPGMTPPTRGYAQPQQTRQSGFQPRIEEQLSESQPFAQETIVYTVRIVSSENLEQVDIDLPKSDAVVFKKLDGPNARVRQRAGQREIINEFRYALTPLHAGQIELSPIQVSGTKASNGYGRNGQEFETSGKRRLNLDVKPAVPGVRPWLPLQHLALRSELLGAEEPTEGQPFTLMLELKAVGATGSQLPSLEQQLQSPDFRVYREQTRAEGGLSNDGRRLEGVRQEFYTLVPQHGGDLKLPALRLAWWNVTNSSVQYASVPTQPLAGSGGLFGGYSFSIPGDTFFLAGSSSVFWVPLAAIFGLMAGYWLAVWMRGQRNEESGPSPLAPLLLRLRVFGGALWRFLSPALGRMREPLADAGSRAGPALGEMGRQIGQLLAKLSPLPYWLRLREKLVNALPRSLRFWFSVRLLREESEPGQWCQRLKRKGFQHLGLSAQAPLSKLAERIIDFHRSANPQRTSSLLRDLDGAIYGGRDLDFEQWKRDFSSQVRPGLNLWPRGRAAKAGALPSLNPITS